MDAFDSSSIAQVASPNLPTVLTPSAQAGTISSTTIQAPEVSALTPPAALQYQFNIQQSLLMQQYALAHQAAVKTMTVKSAAEVAAARAAEISKQLEKKSQSSSPSKSTSRSPLRSKSRSRSRSHSRSPIRKRRAHSSSLSPIRYRRDYYSSYRQREHYGYRGYSYRSYNRGSYDDYSRYRHGLEHYHRHGRRRRSRTRSRSRSPRRDRSMRRRRSLSPRPAKSRPHTRSPRDLQKKSVSPRGRRDGTKSRHNSTRSVSREAVRSPSVSSRSVRSPPAKSRSRSSPVKAYDEVQSPSMKSRHELDKEPLAFIGRKPKRGSSVSSHGRLQSSSSAPRSLSVSLDNQGNRSAGDKVAAKQRSLDESCESIKALSSDDREETSKRMPSDEHVSPVERSNCKMDESEALNKHSGGVRRIRKPTQSPNTILTAVRESSDEILDDWRDDLKQVVNGKGFPTFKEGEPDRLEGRGRSEVESSVQAIARDVQPKHESNLPGASPGHSGSALAVGEQDVFMYKGYAPVVVCGDEKSQLGERRPVSVLENDQEFYEEGDQLDQVLDDNIVFEGPQPASPVYEQKKQKHEVGGRHVRAKRSSPEKSMTGSLRIAQDDNYRTMDSNRCHSRDNYVEYRSRSRDCKKYTDKLTKHEKHRDRHRKQRKKHKNLDKERVERDGARRRHKRKHMREEGRGNKERKKRKHKHKTISSSVSLEGSSSESEGKVKRNSRRERAFKKHKAAKRDLLELPPLSASLA